MDWYIKPSTFPSFTYGGATFTPRATYSQQLFYYSNGYHFGGSVCCYSCSVATSNFPDFKYEIQYLSNNVVSATTGQFAAHTFDTSSIHEFSLLSGPGLSDPFYDGRACVLRFIIRINGTLVMQKDVRLFSPPQTSRISLSYSASQQTGKVYNVTVSGMQANAKAKLEIRTLAYSRNDGSGGKLYTYVNGYLNSGSTIVKDYTLNSAISSFGYYFPYYTNVAHDYNDGLIKLIFTFDISDDLTGSTDTYTLSYTGITWSYVNQSDGNAGPVITLHAVTCTPANVLTKYGKYVGGGITQLAFGWNYQCKYGSSFQSVQYQLYSSGGTLINTWTYNSVTALSLSLTNTSDASYYVRVTITASNGASNAVNYSTFDVYGYSIPYIRRLEVRRCNQDGTANDSGAYCRISWAFKVIPLGNVNTKTVVLVAPDGSHTFTGEDYDHTVGYYYISVADIEHSYAISLSVTDDFQTVSKTVNVSTAGVIMDFLYDGKGIGLGKVAETTEMVEVNPQWTFKADKMTFKGQDLETILTSLGYVFPT